VTAQMVLSIDIGAKAKCVLDTIILNMIGVGGRGRFNKARGRLFTNQPRALYSRLSNIPLTLQMTTLFMVFRGTIRHNVAKTLSLRI
jgi:hypothetical protein